MGDDITASTTINDPGLRRLAGTIAKELRGIIADLDKHTKNTNIARVTGGVVGVAGTVVSVAGLIAIPFTAGLSALVVGIGGGIAGAAGGLTAAGAKITHLVIEKSKISDAQEEWSTFMKGLEKALETRPEMMQSAQDVLAKNMLGLGLSTTSIASNVGAAIVRGSRATTSIAEAGARVAATTVAGSVVLNVFLLGLSMYDMIDGSIELHKEKTSEAGDALQKFAECLETFDRTGILQ